MTTITLQYDTQNSVIQHLIEALLAAGATMQTNDIRTYDNSVAAQKNKQCTPRVGKRRDHNVLLS